MSDLDYLIGKNVEVAFSNDNSTIMYADIQRTRKDVIVGKLISTGDAWTIIRVYNKKRTKYNDVAINNYSINSILEAKKDLCSADVYISDVQSKNDRVKGR